MNNEMPKQKDYKPLKPFKLCCMNNFPFIDADFDALTNWELLCKVSEYLNDVVYNQNNLEYNQTSLYDYVTNYLANLDIQEEIDNKLDEMAESGELAEIIAQYVELQGIVAYNTLNDLIDAENLQDGSFAKTFGKITLNDGDGAFYKIRTVTSGDIIDGVNKIALTNYPTLIAVLIIDNNIINLNSDISEINTNIGALSNLNTTNKTSIVNAINEVNSNTTLPLTELVIFGDSWADPVYADWGKQAYIGNQLNLNVHNYAKSGAYMYGNGNDDLSTQITTFNNDTSFNKNTVKYIIILGGINDYRHNVTAANTASSLTTQATALKTACPNAKILYVSNCQYPYSINQGVFFDEVHMRLREGAMIPSWNMFNTLGKALYNSDNYFHLNSNGEKYMLANIICMLTGGELQYYTDNLELDVAGDGFVEYGTQRIGNIIIMTFQIYARTAKTSFTFSVGENDPDLSYAGTVFTGAVTYGYKRLVAKVNERNIQVSFDSNTEASTYYYASFIISLRNSLPR